MKSLLLLVLIVILSVFSVTAQNWSLVMPNDTLVYEKQDHHQFFTVWVDSTEVYGTDTTYFMNRISPGEVIGTIPRDSLCDTNNWTSTFDLMRLFTPQFCGSSVTKSDSKWTITFPQNQFVIYPNKNVGSTWVYDSLTMESMTITSADTAYLRGYELLDSIKIIQYGTNKIIISKSHGLFSYYDFRDSQSKFSMIGVQNLSKGITIPMGLDFFDFEVGDLFRRRLEWGDSDNHGLKYEIKKITSKQQNGDTLIYIINNSIYGIKTEKYWPTKYPFLNNFPNTLNYISKDYYKSPYVLDTILMQVFVGRNSKGQTIKGTGLKANFHNILYCVNNDSTIASGDYSDLGYRAQYQPGLGLIQYEYPPSLYIESVNLLGYIKNGDTTGIVNSVPPILVDGLFNIYPNPTNTTINITTEKLNGISVLEMYDLQGRLITTNNFESKLILDVSEWSSGVYFAVIKDTDGAILHREKLIIQ